jgi:hypothetical protein
LKLVPVTQRDDDQSFCAKGAQGFDDVAQTRFEKNLRTGFKESVNFILSQSDESLCEVASLRSSEKALELAGHYERAAELLQPLTAKTFS